MTEPTLDDARALLRASFGYEDFRPGQETAVGSVLTGRDTMVILPTGGGKSLCFQVPGLLLPGLTVVVSPLISLMKDQVDALTARGLPAAFINSTLTSAQVSDRMARASRGEIKLLYLAPERFDAGTTAQQLRRIGVSLLAVDEAHCISQWGHDFRPSYLRVREVRDALGDPPTIALTATATPHVREDIAQQLALRDPKVIITGFDRKNLTYHVLPARNDAEKDALLVDTLRQREGLAVVYASTRKAVERITQMLQRIGVPAAGYHAGLDDEHRHEVQDLFMQERVRVIVATNAFGMGIDKPNVRSVIHHAMPGTLEAYYQEAGRAGRDGEHSDVFLLHAFPDRFTHEYFVRGAYPERALVEEVYQVLQRRADPSGIVTDSYDRLASLVTQKASARDVESALRIMELGGAVSKESESLSKVHVRLLATPGRIKQEVTGDANMELGLLRALWRAAGEAVYDGAVIDLQGLPPGLGAPPELIDALEALQSRQFLTFTRVGGGIALTSAARPLSYFRIDWSLLDRRRATELSKLQWVQRYAYTKECRRAFILRYFGDPAARQRCTGCDNCLGIAVERQTGPAPKAPRPPKPPRAASASRPVSAPAAVAAAQPGWSTAMAARDGEEAPSRSARAKTVAEILDELPDDARPVFERLASTRTRIAQEEQVPAYIVFDNKTLYQMAIHRPRSLEAFQALRGVGPVKTQKYGSRFVAAIIESLS